MSKTFSELEEDSEELDVEKENTAVHNNNNYSQSRSQGKKKLGLARTNLTSKTPQSTTKSSTTNPSIREPSYNFDALEKELEYVEDEEPFTLTEENLTNLSNQTLNEQTIVAGKSKDRKSVV